MSTHYIIIGTTSLNRTELHNDVFPDWINWLTHIHNNDKRYNIVWFINIDIIKNLDDSYETTVDNYKKLVSNHPITQIFLKNPDDSGNFLYACKRISENIVKYVDENNIDGKLIKICWLEDDWKLNSEIAININDLINNYSGDLTHINLTYIRNNYIWALAPSIISYNLWKQLHYTAWLNQTDIIDPEHCVGLHCINNISKPDDLYNLTIINKEIKENFFTQKYLNYTYSYYTYFDKITSLVNDKYIDRNKFSKIFNNKIIFVRITPNFCCDFGRQFMNKKKIEKIGISKNNTEFYIIH